MLGRLGLSGAGRAGSEALAGAGPTGREVGRPRGKQTGPRGEGKESWAWVEFWAGLSSKSFPSLYSISNSNKV